MAVRKKLIWNSNLSRKLRTALGQFGLSYLLRALTLLAFTLVLEIILLEFFDLLALALPFSEWYLAAGGLICLVVALLISRLNVAGVALFLRNTGGILVCLAVFWRTFFHYGLAAFWLLPLNFLFGEIGWGLRQIPFWYDRLRTGLQTLRLMGGVGGSGLNSYLAAWVVTPLRRYAIYLGIPLALLGMAALLLLTCLVVAGSFILPLLPTLLIYWLLRRIWNRLA